MGIHETCATCATEHGIQALHRMSTGMSLFVSPLRPALPSRSLAVECIVPAAAST